MMFWGAMTGDGPLALVPIEGTMNSRKYVHTLDTHLVPFLENQPLLVKYVFQHDNAPCHKSRETTAFLTENAIDMLDSWPPYSPDLNIIENLWAFMKRKLKSENIGSKVQLRQRALEVWNSEETKALCARLADSMSTRIAECMANKGGYTKY
jgi:transposase